MKKWRREEEEWQPATCDDTHHQDPDHDSSNDSSYHEDEESPNSSESSFKPEELEEAKAEAKSNEYCYDDELNEYLAMSSPSSAEIEYHPEELDSSRKRSIKKEAIEDSNYNSEDNGKNKKKKTTTTMVWSKNDNLNLLQSLYKYAENKRADPVAATADMNSFYNSFKKTFHCKVTRLQVADKVRKLKKKFKDNLEKKGKTFSFSNLHEKNLYELSKNIWGLQKDSRETKCVVNKKLKFDFEGHGMEAFVKKRGLSVSCFKDTKKKTSLKEKWNEFKFSELETTRRQAAFERELYELALDELPSDNGQINLDQRVNSDLSRTRDWNEEAELIVVDKQGGQVGLVLDCEWAEAHSEKNEDKTAAARRLDFQLGWYLHPIYFGDYPEVMQERLGDRLPKFSEEEKDLLRNSIDFVGLNHYTSRFIAHVPDSPEEGDFYKAQEMERIVEWEGGEKIGEKAASEWLYVVPWGIRKVLNYIAQRYNNPPIYVTENGMDDEDNETSPLHEMLDDKLRVVYYKRYLAAVAQAIKDGVDVRGYFAWSLLDNFEWAQGGEGKNGKKD
nr:beta-glucosidase 4 [Quercus suber]